MARCINRQCGQEAMEELGYCSACQPLHKKQCEELDARPIQKFERIPTPIASVRQIVSGGVTVTISTEEPLKFRR